MQNTERQKRAALRRQRMVITRCRLEESDIDPHPTFGAEAVSLASVLTREMWSLSGQAFPNYSRSDTPYRFVKHPIE